MTRGLELLAKIVLAIVGVGGLAAVVIRSWRRHGEPERWHYNPATGTPEPDEQWRDGDAR